MRAVRLKTRSPMYVSRKGRTVAQAHPYIVMGAATVGALAISALVTRRLARNAERDNPPAGQMLEVNGVRLHYVERGSGAPLVLLHGNGSMIQDFEIQRVDRFSRQELSRHRFRSSWLRP